MPPTCDFVMSNLAVLEQHTMGLSIGEYLGHGAWGAVFRSSDLRWIIKVTKDFNEQKAIEFVLDKRGKGYEATLFPGLAEVLSVAKVPDLDDDGETLYVIVRENVLPVKDFPIDKKLLHDLDHALYVIEERQAYSIEDAAAALSTRDDGAPYIGRSLRELLYYGYRLVDLDPQNMGLTIRPRLGAPEGSLVMFDISFEEKDDG